MCWTKFENIGHSLKTLGLSQKTLRPTCCPKLVKGLHKYNSNSLAAVLHVNKSNAAGSSKRLYTPGL